MWILVSSQEGVSSCRPAANYARVFHASCGKSVSRWPFRRRLVGILHVIPAPFVRCATIQEIEVEKFMIDTDAKQRMEKTIETVWANFNSIRTGRSNPAMLDKIEPYDKSSSDLGLTPNNVGEVIRLSLPQLTIDRRKEMSKVVAKQIEEGKVALRNIRRDALKAYEKLEKDKKLSKDNVKDLASALQNLRDDFVKKIDCLRAKSEGVIDCIVTNQLYVGHFVGIHRDQTNACITVCFE